MSTNCSIPNICKLNEYVLLKIFEFCKVNELENLCRTCKIFKYIIDNGIYRKQSLNLLMCGHNGKPLNNIRTFNSLSFKDRLQISSNWTNGKYKEHIYLRHKYLYAAKVFLEKNLFYMSHAAYIRIYQRTKKEPLQRKFITEISSSCKSDICDFIKKDQTVFAGKISGNCLIYENDIVTEQKLHSVNEYLTCVDFNKNTFVTCSDKTSKLWHKTFDLGLIHFDLIQDYKIPYKCVEISDDGEKIFGGMYTDLNRKALREIDIETGFQKILNSDSLSIYDIKLKDQNILFTANFDTTFRLFDKRTNRDESIWMDPYDSSVYCLEYDGLFGVVCGMKYHNRVNLYDIRIPKKFIQMYFPSLKKSYGSPVYSLTCDSQYLFVCTDNDLRILDFKADWAPSKDFRNIFVNI